MQTLNMYWSASQQMFRMFKSPSCIFKSKTKGVIFTLSTYMILRYMVYVGSFMNWISRDVIRHFQVFICNSIFCKSRSIYLKTLFNFVYFYKILLFYLIYCIFVWISNMKCFVELKLQPSKHFIKYSML